MYGRFSFSTVPNKQQQDISTSSSTASSEKLTPPQKEIKITKYVIHSYPNEKDNSPSTLEIEKHSGKIKIITQHDPVSVRQLK
jgi:hypothetical protein